MHSRPIWSVAAFLCLFLFACSLRAQSSLTVRGEVVSSAGHAVVGATVQALESDVGGLTNRRGRFALAGLSGTRLVLRVTALGYEETTQVVEMDGNQTHSVRIVLALSAISLDPLLVLAKRTRMVGDGASMGILPGAAHVVGRETIDTPDLIFASAHDILRRVPGVNVQDEDGFGLRPNIGLRGTGVERSSKITIMEDGVLIAPAPYAAPSAYYFPEMGRMEAVEVRQGSSQIRYGPRTVGGALNLVSSSIPDALSWNLDVSGGGLGTMRARARAGDSKDRYGWLVEGSRVRTDGFKRLANGQSTGFDVRDFVGKFRVNTPRGENLYQELEFKVGYNDHVSNETYLGLTAADFGSGPLLRYPASQPDVMDAEHTQFQVRHFLSAGAFNLTSTVYRNDFRRNWYKLQSVMGSGISGVLGDPAANADALAILQGADSGDDALKVRANNREYFAEGVQTVLGVMTGGEYISHDLELGLRLHRDQEDRFQWEDGYRMNAGVMDRTSEGLPGSQSNRVSDAEAVALYVQDEISVGHWTFTPGLRFEHVDFTRTDYAKNDLDRESPARVRGNGVTAWVPGLGISLRAGWGLNLFGGVHRGFAPPGSGADDKTEVESSLNIEMGGRYRRSGLVVQATGFLSDYSNILGNATLANSEDSSGQVFNGGEVDVLGVEFTTDYDLAWRTDWSLRLPVRTAYTYTLARFATSFESAFGPWGTVEVGDRLPYLPEHQISAAVAAETESWSVSVSGVGSTGMRTEAGQGPLDDHSTDEFFVLSGSAELHLGGFGTWYVGVQNIADRRYSVASRPAGFRPGLPRTLITGFRVTR
jgi:Fe(3+) dicitrate transport protein